MGKTELVLASAAQMSAAFDREVFVSLRGFDPVLPPVSWRSVLAGLTRVLCPGAASVAADEEHLALALTEQLRARRTLVVLDDARDFSHIEPLIPALTNARVLVTSRYRSGLPAGQEIVLDCLTMDDAVEYLGSIDPLLVNPAHREEAERIAQACGCLPLQLSLAAATCAERPGWSPQDHRLRLESLPLHEGVRMSVAASFAALDPPMDRTLRTLSLHPGAHVTARAGRALTGESEEVFRQQLRYLANCCLVRLDGTGGYRIHDVIRVEALHRGEDLDAGSVRKAAIARLVKHYSLDAAREVRRVLGPGPVTPEGSAAATAWLVDEADGACAMAVHLSERGRYAEVAAIVETWAVWLEYANRRADALALLLLVLRHPGGSGHQFAATRLSRLYSTDGRLGDGLSWAQYAAALAPGDWVTMSHLAKTQRDAGNPEKPGPR